eukprot:12423675-Karenia_brevis.AAC.1
MYSDGLEYVFRWPRLCIWSTVLIVCGWTGYPFPTVMICCDVCRLWDGLRKCIDMDLQNALGWISKVH